VIYLKCTLAGFLAVLAAAVLTVIIVVVCLSFASRSSQTAIGWDPISLAKPLTWFVVVLAIFLVGFYWQFFRLSSK
jgi:uncharacterized membrane protein YphA (DoxX/SURF4 family)